GLFAISKPSLKLFGFLDVGIHIEKAFIRDGGA
ncbi:hypothetical protein HBJ16_005050, partial [Pseudomonas sp. CES]